MKRIKWTARVSDEWVLNRIKETKTFLDVIIKKKGDICIGHTAIGILTTVHSESRNEKRKVANKIDK